MSRIAKAPVELPAGVTATIAADAVTIKGAKGSLSLPLTAGVSVVQTDKKLQIRFDAEGLARTRAGATRAHLANMVRGVTRGYEKKLELVGVGFRAQVQGKSLNLTLGFSHPVNVPIPEGINIRSEEHTSELQSLTNLVCRLLLEKKKKDQKNEPHHNKPTAKR